MVLLASFEIFDRQKCTQKGLWLIDSISVRIASGKMSGLPGCPLLRRFNKEAFLLKFAKIVSVGD